MCSDRRDEAAPGIDQDSVDFAQTLVTWQRRHGRHDLPWQGTRDPYRVWLSEIMLQQTQVCTVRAYFERFVRRFPDVSSLAAAPLDDVLGLWSGLGYYSRARNLHRCAQRIVQLHGGVFPKTAEQLQTLPGIGPSTAAAVAAICFGERVAILDGNVRRVLTRYLGFDKDLVKIAHVRALWQRATALLPRSDLRHNMPVYTQALMDLGATVCTAKKPNCTQCPLKTGCRAAASGRAQDFPIESSRLKRSAESIWLLWACTADGDVWLSQRPTPGIWAGLFCFEWFASRIDLQASLPEPLAQRFVDLPAFKHTLTHKDLYLHPVQIVVPKEFTPACSAAGKWFGASQWPALGLPAPIRKLLST